MYIYDSVFSFLKGIKTGRTSETMITSSIEQPLYKKQLSRLRHFRLQRKTEDNILW